MKTLNQTLSPQIAVLGHWTMWMNDVIGKLDALRVTPKHKIAVTIAPTVEYASVNGHEWECQHASTTADMIEVYDEYMDAVTGRQQPLRYQAIQVCDECDAWYTPDNDEWHRYE